MEQFGLVQVVSALASGDHERQHIVLATLATDGQEVLTVLHCLGRLTAQLSTSVDAHLSILNELVAIHHHGNHGHVVFIALIGLIGLMGLMGLMGRGVLLTAHFRLRVLERLGSRCRRVVQVTLAGNHSRQRTNPLVIGVDRERGLVLHLVALLRICSGKGSAEGVRSLAGIADP